MLCCMVYMSYKKRVSTKGRLKLTSKTIMENKYIRKITDFSFYNASLYEKNSRTKPHCYTEHVPLSLKARTKWNKYDDPY